MNPTPRRLTALAGLCVLGLLSCGREVTGPEGSAFGGRVAAFAVEPRFPELPGNSHGASEVEPFVRVRILLRGLDGAVALDTMVPFPSTADSITLNLRVPLPAGTPSTGLPLQLLMRYINAAGDTVFAGGPVPVNAVPVGAAGGGQVVGVPIVPTGVGANAAAVVIVPATGSAVAGTTTTFVATARDGQGVAIPGTPVIFSTPDPLGVQMTSVSSGTVTWLPRRGSARVVATLLNGVSATATFTISLPASRLAIVSGNAQGATVSTALAQPVVLRVAASDDVPVAGVQVTFAVATGGGALSTLVATSDVAGNVSTTWTLGALVGAQSISATYPGLVGGPVTVTATGLARPATQLLITAAPTTVVAGAAIPAVAVEARDATGVLVPAFTGPVTLTLNAGATGATLGGTATVNAVAGLATFSGLSIQRAATGLTLSASSGTLAAGTSAAFTVTPAAAATLAAVSGGGQAALAGSVLPTPFVARVVDAFTNPVAGVTVTWSILTVGGSLSVAAAVSDAAGLVSTVLTLPAVAGAVSVQATAAGLAGSPSAFAATALAGAATVLIADPVASGNGQSGVVGTTLAAPLRVRVRDALGNGVAGQSVTWGLTGGAGTLSATTVISDGTGLAQTNLTLGNAAGGVTVSATSAGLTGSPVAFTATALAGVATVATIGVAPTAGTAGVALSPTTVIVRDAFGNVATGFTGNVVVAMISSPVEATLGGTLTQAATAGVATFANLSANTAGAYVLRFTAGALPAVLAPSFTVVAAAPASITTFAGNAQTATVNSVLPAALSARVTDAFSNPVAGVVVTWAVTTGGGFPTPGTSTTDGNGVATSAWTLGGVVGAQSLTATALALPAAPFTATATPLAIAAYNWTGLASSVWNTTANWAENAVPGTTDSVFVPSGLINAPMIPAGVTLRSLISEHDGAPIPVAGDLTITRNVLVSQGGGLECSGGGAVVLGNPVAPMSIAGRFGCLVRVVSGLATATDTVSIVEESMLIEGTGSLDAGADLVSIAGSLTTTGAGTLRMTSDSAVVVVDSDVSFGGGSTAGLLVNGVLVLRGDFTQLGSPSAFAASASHTTVLQAVAPPTVTFANPGSGAAASHFGHLVLNFQSSNSYIALESDVYADGVLRGSGQDPVLQAAQPRLFQSRGADVDGIEFRNVSWRLLDGDARTSLDGVRFNSMSPTAIQMEIIRASGFISMSGPQFSTVPTGVGRYLRVVDSNGIGGAGEDLVVNVSTTNPQYHEGFAEAVAPAAITGWPAAPAAATVNAWTGATSSAWSNVGNWSLGRLPVATDSVVIDRTGTYVVAIDVSATVGWVVVGNLGIATINNTTGATLTINDGGVFLAPTVLNLGGGSTMAGAGGVLIGGTFNWNGGQLASAGVTSILPGGTANIATTGAVTLNDRTLSVSGTVNIGGAGLGNAGTSPAIAVITGGILQFQSPTTLLAGGGNAFLINNGGTIRKTAAGGYVRIDWPITNGAGVIDVEAGTLDLRRPLTAFGTTVVRTGATLLTQDETDLYGQLNVEGGGTVTFSSGGAGLHTLLPGSTLSGLGTVEVNGGVVEVGGAFDVDSLTLTNATLEFNSADTAFVTRGRYIGGGFLRGTGVLAIRGTFSSTTGNINGTGTFAVRPGGTFTVNSPIRGWHIDVAGTMVWGDWHISLQPDPVSLRNPRIDVRSGGVLRIDQGATAREMFANTTNVITTFAGGTIRKTTGTATTLIRASVVHSGLFDVLSAGPISLQFPCTLTGGTFSGTAVIGCGP